MEEVKNKLGKAKAIALVRTKYRDLCGKAKNVTYACKNRTQDNYWATCKPDVLKHDWLLILDDYIGQQIHVFFVEASAIDEDRFKTRRYKNGSHKLHLEILYDDSDFKDRFKGYRFLTHYKATIGYGEKATGSEDASLTKET